MIKALMMRTNKIEMPIMDVGWGEAGVCPACQSQACMLTGWVNRTNGAGKSTWRCPTCGKRWTWARRVK